MRTVSIIIPAYNEERYIGKLIEKILEIPTEKVGFRKEIIVVDDGSSDGTFRIASSYPQVKCLRQIPNAGKGRAVQKGFAHATGDYVLVQDADLEYDPADYLPMLEKVKEGTRKAVYGSRTLGVLRRRGLRLLPGKHERQSLGPWGAGVILSAWTRLLYGAWITDTLTAYKIYPADVLKSFTVKTHGFETDHELTAKLIRAGVPIEEVPIHYAPRSREEGKKIKFQDGLIAVATLLRFRFST